MTLGKRSPRVKLHKRGRADYSEVTMKFVFSSECSGITERFLLCVFYEPINTF